jgi:hypothetical protein
MKPITSSPLFYRVSWDGEGFVCPFAFFFTVTTKGQPRRPATVDTATAIPGRRLKRLVGRYS